MALSETARKSHDQLFPGHVSAPKVTGPELIEIFDDFPFDEALCQRGRAQLRGTGRSGPSTDFPP